MFPSACQNTTIQRCLQFLSLFLLESRNSEEITLGMASSPSGQVVLCTGANRSIGFAILQPQPFASHPQLTSSATAPLRQTKKPSIDELKKLGVKAPIEVLELDVSKNSSIFATFETVKAN